MSKAPILILGARSEIGLAVARRFAKAGHAIQLAARSPESLETQRADIALRSDVPVTLHAFDVLDTASFEGFVTGLPELPVVAVCVVGTMGEQEDNETDLDAATLDLRSNFEGPALILGVLANRFADRGHGTLVGVSSVAGDRGRATNYVYGSAKAGFTAFLSGLRNRLARQDVHVVTVKPGFVNTAMTAGLDLPARLTAEPEALGEAIFAAVRSKRNVIYVKPIWRVVMTVICAIPEPIFKKLRL